MFDAEPAVTEYARKNVCTESGSTTGFILDDGSEYLIDKSIISCFSVTLLLADNLNRMFLLDGHESKLSYICTIIRTVKNIYITYSTYCTGMGPGG